MYGTKPLYIMVSLLIKRELVEKKANYSNQMNLITFELSTHMVNGHVPILFKFLIFTY